MKITAAERGRERIAITGAWRISWASASDGAENSATRRKPPVNDRPTAW
jgi:hypothetical protein